MDPVCEEKYNFLQKYVPFLANLIKQLSDDIEKQSKKAQMQLLYDLLNNPDNSVKIETLEKCEEVLCRVFGNNDEKAAEDEWVMPLPLIKAELPDTLEDGTEKIEEKIWENLNGSTGHKGDDNSTAEIKRTSAKENQLESINSNDIVPEILQPSGNHENSSQGSILTPCPSAEETVEIDNVEHSSNHHTSDEKAEEMSMENDSMCDINDLSEVRNAKNDGLQNKDEPTEQQQKDSIPDSSDEPTEQQQKDSIPDCSINQGNNEEHLEENTNKFELEEEKTVDKLSTIIESSDELASTSDVNKPLGSENTQGVNSSAAVKEALLNCEEETLPMVGVEKTRNSLNESETQTHQETANVETIPRTEENSLSEITPPCEEVTQEVIDTSTENSEKVENSTTENTTPMIEFKIISTESLAADTTEITVNDGTNSGSSENLSSYAKDITTTPESEKCTSDQLDPLDNTNEPNSETNTKAVEGDSTSAKTPNKDDEDDDVLLVENRSSPICIDSDPEDEQNVKGNCSLPIMPSNVSISKQNPPQPKSNVRKSTSAVVETIRKIIKNQNITAKRKLSINKPKQNSTREAAGFVKKDPKALMETIDLLDSDSEDEKSKSNKNTNSYIDDDDVIIVSSTQPARKMLPKPNQTGAAAKPIARPYSKSLNKSPAKPATAQSNFLNAVNLQPAKSCSSNPATFSARLSNKKVIIPNAFYGNPSYNRKSSSISFSSTPGNTRNNDQPASNNSALKLTPPTRAVGVHSGVSIRHVQDKVLKEWLDGFLTNFASPLQIASHACFVLLQRVLKYRFFQRLKETRIFLNQAAKTCSAESVDVQMLLDLRNVFLENDYLTEAGRRFCRFATNDAFGKPVALTTDSRTGKVTCRTRVAAKGDLPTNIVKIPKPITLDKPVTATIVQQSPVSATPPPPTPPLQSKPTIPSPLSCSSSSTSTPTSLPKRRGKFRKLSDGLIVAEKDEDDNDYTPAQDEIEPEAEVVTERKRSLRTNRTKRKEAGFTYSEDHDDEEFEALARKIENKKREELRLAEEKEIELEKESSELEYRINKKIVAKKTTSKRSGVLPDSTKGPTRKKLRLASATIVNSEENDLLTPTWIEADADDGEVDSLLDFADDPELTGRDSERENENGDEDDAFQNDDKITCAIQDSSSETFDMQTDQSLKNIDRNLHMHNKAHDLCVHCSKRVPRIVHHYVNEHRSSEVFVSRLRNRDIRRLLTTSNVGFVHLYKCNQIQYAAHCIFCDKEAKFLLPYWFEHFTMHTGEYSFKCSGCHILKPTRSLLTNHISNAGCPKKGKALKLINFDTKVHQIEAHICTICNYTQLQRKNVLRHLRTQHGLDTISPEQIIKVVLLQISAPQQDAAIYDASQLALIQNSDDEGDLHNTLDDNSLMMQNDFTDNDDLSFMICGMLDVQTNLSPTGRHNLDKT